MAQLQAFQPLEGLSTTKPLFFDGTNYNYWKNMIKVYMLANVPKAWIVTMKGQYVLMKGVGESKVPKEEVEWNDEDLEKIMINNKAISMLQCSLNPMEYNRVSGCDTAKEMWDMLEILRSLPKNWEAKKTAIEKSKDLNTLKLEDLIGKLMIYEIAVQVDDGVEVVEKKKKKKKVKMMLVMMSLAMKRTSPNCDDDDSGKPSKKHIKCYECNEMRHYRVECPKLKKGKKNKAFVAPWSNDECSSSGNEGSLEDDVSNPCFIA
ncbi:hypothetical protein SLEP1_g37187 [Rubroshorea leprosula]|uniref:CCHC-type domain-containing protein n=1 Tax=Rubroshorea leprosula TaxID=152421 RepID=A0AAV5KU43_9ROSI|nr:hypothetical protein SLEP1_g37187 [Rubroshorea leprosula]